MSNEDGKKFITPGEAANILKINKQSLINWEKQGRIKAIRTKGGHRRYLYSSLFPSEKNKQGKRRKICYARTSTSSQKEDLERQIDFFKNKFPNYEIIRDIGSGINFKRKGFNSILDSAIKGDIEEIVVTHRDRFCRFGFDFFKRIIEEYSNGKILVLNNQETSKEKELVDDLISIVTVFSARIYGQRSHKIKKELQNFKDKIVS